MEKPVRSAVDTRSKKTDGDRSSPAPNTRNKTLISCAEGTLETTGLRTSGSDVKLHDAWLVELAQHGDHRAFGVLVRRYERKLIRVLTRLVHEPEQARDLAQETFWRAYTSLDRFDTGRRFGPWLLRIGVNIGLDWLRHSKCEPLPTASIDRTGTDGQAKFELPDPDPRARADLAQEVQFVLARLPVSYRTILVLRDLEGFSSSEVAAIVGRREATVRWRLSLARERFREIWQQRQEGAPGEGKDGTSRHA